MSKVDNGGPAFPIPLNPGESYTEHGKADGMTLRDWFAGQALVAIGAADMRSEMPIVPETMARNAYALADAMIAERAKGVDSHG